MVATLNNNQKQWHKNQIYKGQKRQSVNLGCGEIKRTLKHSECNKLNESGDENIWAKLIHYERCKWLFFDYRNQPYTYRHECLVENEMNKIFWAFEIQTDSWIRDEMTRFVRRKQKENTLSDKGFRCSGKI